MHFFLYQQVIQTVAQVASLLSQQNNNKQNDYFLRTLTTAREHLQGKTRPKVKAKKSSQELTCSHGKPSKGQQSTERTALIFKATAKHLNGHQYN